ncbi:MAG: hypothetical protein KF789_07470, partial [Bdellovibrionaceae bacterium]|nr:hypothetical protein [Pseudobdellovibrionaceae bacterium]
MRPEGKNGKIGSRQWMGWGLLCLLSVMLLPQGLFADSGVTYHGRLLRPNGQPVTSSTVQFRLQIRTPLSSDCLLFEEVQTKDLSVSSGLFTLSIGDGTATVVNTEPFSLSEVFRNNRTLNFPAGKCVHSPVAVLGPTESRQLKVSFNDGSFGGWEPLPAQTINFVPMAIESVSVGGHTSENLFRVHSASNVAQTMDPWSPTSYQKLLDLVANTTISGGNVSIGGTASGFTGSLSGDVTGGQSSTKVGAIQNRAVLDVAPANGQVLTWNNAQTRWEPAGVPAVGNPDWSDIVNAPTSLPPSGTAGGDLSGSTYPNPVIANNAVSGAKIADGGVAFNKIAAGSATGQVLQYESGVGWKAEKLLYTELVKAGGGSPWPSSACGAGEAVIWQSATDGFECAPISITEADPSVKAFAKNDPSSDFSTPSGVLTLNTVPIARGGTGAVSQAGAINNLLPAQGSSAGKILQTDGTNVSWVDAPASGVTSINGATGGAQTFQTAQANTTPTFTRSGDTHTLEIPQASTNGVTAGTISYTDYQVFNGKQSALGFTPLNPANHLSELSATASTARTNLGLGTAATKNFGTASGNLVELDAGGRIPASLLPNQKGTYFAQGGNAFGVPAVLGTTDAQPLHLQTDGTNRLTILSDGRVGIGTDTPSTPLDIRGSGTGLSVEATGGGRIHLKGNTSGGVPAVAAVLHLESNADYRGRGMYLSTTDEEANAAWFV